LLAGIVGFSFIIFGLSIGLTNSENGQLVAIMSTAAGIITNFIAGVFFYLYNRTVQQLKNYHDSLLDVQNVLLSFKIIGDLKDDVQKANMTIQMLSFLTNKQKNHTAGTPSTPQDSAG
jgi:phosphate/sulfate permease